MIKYITNKYKINMHQESKIKIGNEKLMADKMLKLKGH